MREKINDRLVKTLIARARPCSVTDAELSGFALRMLPSGLGSYSYVFRTRDGRKRRYTIGPTTKWTAAQARDEARRVCSRVNLGEDPFADKRQAGVLTLGSYLDEHYLPWMKAQRKTGEKQVHRIKTGFSHLLEKRIDEITAWVVEKHRTERLKKDKVKPSTVNKDVAALKSALTRAVTWDLLTENPLAKVKSIPEVGGSIFRYLDEDEERRLLDALDAREERIRAERDSYNQWAQDRRYEPRTDLRQSQFADYLKPMVLLSLHTGMRRGEVFSLHWCDVDFQQATIRVRDEITKTSRTRYIYLNEVALAVLRDWRSQTSSDGLVFPSPVTGGLLNNVKKAWTGILKDAKISRFRWHDMRHHFATRLVMAGVDLYVVKELLGHASISMTERYAHLAPSAKREAVGRIVQMRCNPSEVQLADTAE